jgi:hypothetical protein
VLSPKGDTLLNRLVRYAPVGGVDQYLEDRLFSRIDWTTYPIDERTFRRLAYMPRFFPPVSAASLGIDGSIWIGRENLGDGAPLLWQVYQEDGMHIFT